MANTPIIQDVRMDVVNVRAVAKVLVDASLLGIGLKPKVQYLRMHSQKKMVDLVVGTAVRLSSINLKKFATNILVSACFIAHAQKPKSLRAKVSKKLYLCVLKKLSPKKRFLRFGRMRSTLKDPMRSDAQI
jgi:hypothetical protein